MTADRAEPRLITPTALPMVAGRILLIGWAASSSDSYVRRAARPMKLAAIRGEIVPLRKTATLVRRLTSEVLSQA